MDQQDGKERESERVAELESEVAQLRQALAAREGAPAAASAGGKATGGFAASRLKMALVGAVVAIVALATIVVLFSALSSGFSSFAHKAAKVLAPDGEEVPAAAPQDEPEKDEPTPGPAKEALPPVPGL